MRHRSEDASTTPTTLCAVPLWLAHQHRSRAVGDLVDVHPDVVGLATSTRHGPGWDVLVSGAGFAQTADPGRLKRLHTLPDLVGPNLRVLVIGLNPSPSSADTGIGFARPGNRFWPAALAAGLASLDRDPLHALANHGIGFTDIVKRTTRQASELRRQEFRDGMDRLDALCGWLQPRACVMIGLQGWRAAVDAKAVASWQDTTLGGSPVYVMPSTSGLNARSSLADLTNHMVEVVEVVDEAHG